MTPAVHFIQGEEMKLKGQEGQVNKLQERINTLVDELRVTQAEIKTFKEAVARDMQRVFEQLKK